MLEPTTPRSQVKHSTTEPLAPQNLCISLYLNYGVSHILVFWYYRLIGAVWKLGLVIVGVSDFHKDVRVTGQTVHPRATGAIIIGSDVEHVDRNSFWQASCQGDEARGGINSEWATLGTASWKFYKTL